MFGDSRSIQDRDQGAVLLLVLAVSIVLSLVVLALANFVAADLRYSQVVDAQAKRVASAESGIHYAVDRLRLNQTLCATNAAAGGPVNLDGSGSGPAGTPLLEPLIGAVPQPVNGTNTRVTCERLDDPLIGPIADVAGWAVVIANDGTPPPPDQIQLGAPTATINGPVFLPGAFVNAPADDDQIGVVDGDLWYTGCGTSYSNTHLADRHIDILSPAARGGICTPRFSDDVFRQPPEPILPTNPDPGPDTTSSCRVFSPGHYTTIPDFGTSSNVYFKSGDYHLDFDAEWSIEGAQVWIGHPGPLTNFEELPNEACETARNADQANGGPGWRHGATFYFDRASRLLLKDGGNVEMFPRQQGTHSVSVQARPGSTASPLIQTYHFLSATDLVINGLVWAPHGRLTFDIDFSDSKHMMLGGVVVRGLDILQMDPDEFEIAPATSTVDTRVLLTSTSTMNGVSTTVEAVVAYRPHAPLLKDRVAVTSFRVVD